MIQVISILPSKVLMQICSKNVPRSAEFAIPQHQICEFETRLVAVRQDVTHESCTFCITDYFSGGNSCVPSVASEQSSNVKFPILLKPNSEFRLNIAAISA